jgi:hypothetical protein
MVTQTSIRFLLIFSMLENGIQYTMYRRMSGLAATRVLWRRYSFSFAGN